MKPVLRTEAQRARHTPDRPTPPNRVLYANRREFEAGGGVLLAHDSVTGAYAQWVHASLNLEGI